MVLRHILAGVNYFFRWRLSFLPVLSLHHWSTIARSDAQGRQKLRFRDLLNIAALIERARSSRSGVLLLPAT